MIEYGIAIAEKRDAGRGHEHVAFIVRETFNLAKAEGFVDPPIGTKLPNKSHELYGPIRKGVYASMTLDIDKGNQAAQLTGRRAIAVALDMAERKGLLDEDLSLMPLW